MTVNGKDYLPAGLVWKVPFSAREVLDMVLECDSLQEFEGRFCKAAEERARS